MLQFYLTVINSLIRLRTLGTTAISLTRYVHWHKCYGVNTF